MWLSQSISRLVRRGHSIDDIADYTLDQFVIFLDAAEQIEAEERTNFVTDMASVVGSLFSKESPIKSHLELLRSIRLGEYDGGGQ